MPKWLTGVSPMGRTIKNIIRAGTGDWSDIKPPMPDDKASKVEVREPERDSTLRGPKTMPTPTWKENVADKLNYMRTDIGRAALRAGVHKTKVGSKILDSTVSDPWIYGMGGVRWPGYERQYKTRKKDD